MKRKILSMEKTSPKVLIIVLNYVTYDMTLDMINALKKTLDYDNYSVMVIDNCSPNESAIVLKEYSEKVGYIFYANKINSGYAAGNNIGLRYAIEHGYKYSWILNNDVEIKEKMVLSEMVRVLEENDEIGCIGPKIYNFDGSICAPYCNRPSMWSMTFGIFADKSYRNKHINTQGIVYRVYGCCMLLRNQAMSSIDCMDERTFLYGEEDILAERLMRKSYVTYYCPWVSIVHLGSISVKKMSSKKKIAIEQAKSMELYLKEYRKIPFFLRKVSCWVRQLIIYLN